MKSSSLEELHDWIIVGGGIHGTHIAVRLLSQHKGTPLKLKIVDPNSCLLCNWKNQTSSTKMKYLRSPSVHHLAPEPFALRNFAGTKPKQRRGKFSFPYQRPLLKLFNKHCESLVNEYSLDRLHYSDLVEKIEVQSGLVSLKTVRDTQLHSKRIVLALGQSDQLCIPKWVRKDASRVTHIFSPNFNSSLMRDAHTIAIIGGGITAIQAALYAESVGAVVHIVSRHPLRKHQFDSDPGWLGPKFMAKFSREHDYSRRRTFINGGRNTGSVPPELLSKVQGRIHSGNILFHKNEVLGFKSGEGQVSLTLRDDRHLKVDRVILATGFEKVRPGGDMLDQLINRHNLPVADCGFPVVDRTLAWHPLIHVSGALAELELGPTAKNIAGARVAADRILSALASTEQTPATTR